MKVIIEIGENNIASIDFLEDDKYSYKNWSDLTKEEQTTLVNTLIHFAALFNKCIKE